MASVFLSYDRDDAAKARPIALALEKAGHSVWWDLNVRGGAQFSKVIEEALKAADAVVVLWSAYSVESAWVRDEAAAGRDSGRLVPIALDGTQSPLGFRQFQTIDFSGWHGRGKPAQFAVLVNSVSALARPGSLAQPEDPPSAVERGHGVKRGSLLIGALMIALLAAAAVSLLVWQPWSSKAVVPIVAVAAAQNNASSSVLARDLLVKLATLQSSSSGSIRLVNQTPGNRQPADLLFEIADDSRAARPAANLVLMIGNDRTVLWSGDFAQESGNLADLKQQVAFTSARVLGCALEGLSPEKARLPQGVLKLYLNACAQLGETYYQDASRVIPVLEKVTKQAPRFTPAWAKLLIADTQQYEAMTADQRKAAAANLRRRIAEARTVDPELPEAYLAEIELLPGRTFYEQMTLIDRSLKAGPDNSFVLIARSIALLGVGRMEAAVEDARRAADLDPLSPAMRNGYIQALSYAGRIDAAKAELAKAERLWPGATTILNARYRLNLRSGDPADALRLLRSGAVEGGRSREAFLEARVDPTKRNVDRAIGLAMTTYRNDPESISDLIQVLGAFNKRDELFAILFDWQDRSEIPYVAEILFRPALANLRADPRFMHVAARFGLVDYWQRSGKWPDFCDDPDLPYDCKEEAAKPTA